MGGVARVQAGDQCSTVRAAFVDCLACSCRCCCCDFGVSGAAVGELLDRQRDLGSAVLGCSGSDLLPPPPVHQQPKVLDYSFGVLPSVFSLYSTGARTRTIKLLPFR